DHAGTEPLAQAAERVVPVRRCDDLPAVHLEEDDQDVAQLVIVLDEKDLMAALAHAQRLVAGLQILAIPISGESATAGRPATAARAVPPTPRMAAIGYALLAGVAIVVGSRFGLVGVATGVAGVRALTGVIGLALAAHAVGLRPSGVLRPLAPALGGMVAMVVVTVAARHALDVDRPVALLAAQVGFGAAAYAPTLQGLAPRAVRSLARRRVVRAVRA